MTISCVIPSYIKHVKYLDRLLASINECTVKPDVVILAVSEVNEIQINDYGLPLIKIIEQGKKNRAQNLNIVCRNVTTDIISIIDSDDLCHTQRFEYLLEVFQDKTIDAVVHNFHQTKEPDYNFIQTKYDKCIYKKDYINELFPHIPYPTNKEKMDYPDYANGHVSFRKGIFEKIKFNELPQYEYLEDSKFNRDIVEARIKITYIENKLTNYIKNPDR